MQTAASLTDGQEASWALTTDGQIDLRRTLAAADHFRRDPGLINPKAFAPLWPLLLWLSGCLFFGDVAVRRIALDVDRIRNELANRWRSFRGQEPQAASTYMDQLKSRKAEVSEQLDRSRAATRFDPTAVPGDATRTSPIDEPLLEGTSPRDRSRPERPGPGAGGPGLGPASSKPEEAGYTNRLLKAKQRVWEERDKDKPKDKPKDKDRPKSDPGAGS